MALFYFSLLYKPTFKPSVMSFPGPQEVSLSLVIAFGTSDAHLRGLTSVPSEH